MCIASVRVLDGHSCYTITAISIQSFLNNTTKVTAAAAAATITAAAVASRVAERRKLGARATCKF